MTLTPTSIRFTASGLEVPAVTAQQMREVDRIAMEETGPNLFQMMENAGRNLAALSMELLGTAGILSCARRHWRQWRRGHLCRPTSR